VRHCPWTHVTSQDDALRRTFPGTVPPPDTGNLQAAQTIHGEGMTILMVEQNVKQTLAICDRAYVLENGRIVLEGKGRDLLEDEKVKQAFLGI